MKTCRLDEIFEIVKHTGYDLNKLGSGKTPYVGASGVFNGVTSLVSSNDIKTYKNVFSIALSGTVLATFYHKVDTVFTPSKNITLFKPKENLDFYEVLFYKTAIEKNKKRFSYGRTANSSRVKALQIPTRDSIPDWVYDVDIEEIKKGLEPVKISNQKIDASTWEEYKVTDLFKIEKGDSLSARIASDNPGKTPYISATSINNGASYFTSKEKTHVGNFISVSSNGSVGEFFYQPEDCIVNSDCKALYLKNNVLTQNKALFLCSVLRLWKSFFDYGRKLNTDRLNKLTIKLPTKNGEPDWDYIETFMENLKQNKDENKND